MQYDWTGTRTRRIRRLKLTIYTGLALVAVMGPAALLPGAFLEPLLTFAW